jgi:membrane peptidoglycan carboxypeptidase
MLAGRPRRAPQRDARPRDDWEAARGAAGALGSKFSQTADGLRSRLGVGGSGGSRSGGDADTAGRSGSRRHGAGSADLNGDAGYGRAGGAGRGVRRMSAGRGPAYPGEPGDYGVGGYDDDLRVGGRTALRDQPDEFWQDGESAGRTFRSRVTDRRDVRWPDVRRGGGGGRGGGNGRGGGGGRGPGQDPRSGGERFKDWLLYGSWWRHWTWKKLLLVIGGGFAAMAVLGVIGIAVLYSMTPIPTDVSQTANWQSSSVYFSNGQLLGTFTNNQDINRQLLSTSQIPPNVENAIIAAEDRNFYHEGGISLTGILRAGYDDIFGSGGLQGGSTLTEQYAKNYYANIGASRTYTTKVKEIFVAIKLAHSRSKPWILSNYLNTVAFGDNVYGVWAGAEHYFGKNLAKQGTTLSTAQAAMLASMPNNPAVFNPDPTAGIGYTMLVQRWQYVLGNMVRDHAISQQEANSLCVTCALPQAEKAFNAAIQLHETSSNGWTGTTGYLMSMVQQELEATYHYSQTKIDTGGLRITTTFSPSMMRALTKAVTTEKRQMAASGVPLPSYDHFGISLENPKTGAIIAIYGGPGYDVPNCTRLFCDYNMAEAPHPVGSSMKPYVLAAAINEGMDVQNSVLNGYSPLWIPPDWTAQDRGELSSQKPPAMGAAAAKSNGWWESVGDAPLGPISVAVAAAQSSDPAFTDLAHRVGVQDIINTAQAFGVGSDPFNLGNNDLQGLNALFGPKGSIPGSVQIALGQGDLTPIEQASTFATLIDGGVYHAPHVISKLYIGQQQVPLRVATHTVMTAAAASDEDYALSFDNINGTAYPNATWPGRPVIGKTGTLGNGSFASEAWFVGAIPQYAMAVGLWTNSQTQNLDNLLSLGGIGGSFGGAWPAATWKTFMETQFANLPVENLPTPNYVGFTKWVQALPKAPKKPVCQQGQYQNCRCPKGQTCQSPNPTQSCQFGQFGQQCGGGGTPTPTPTCTYPGQQQCVSPSPGATPCVPQPGQPCPAGTTAVVSGAGPSPSGTSAALIAVLSPAEEILLVRAPPPPLLL